MAGVLASIAATVSFLPMPRAASAEARRAAAAIEFRIGEALLAMDHGEVIGKHAGRALQHGKRRQRLEIGGVAGQLDRKRCWSVDEAAGSGADGACAPHARRRQTLRWFGCAVSSPL